VTVDLVALAVDVRPWARQPVLREQGEEGLFEVAERDVRTERAAQRRDAGLVGLRAMQASTWIGVVRWCTHAS